MSYIINERWLKENNACKEGVTWFKNQTETDLIKIIEKWIEEKERLEWATWAIVRAMEYKQYVSYAVYSAEQVIDIYEKKYLSNKKPREAIEAAKRCILDSSEENKKIARDAASAAAYAADSAADAAASAAASAAYAASAAAYAADSAAYAADSAAAAASTAAAYSDEKIEMRIKILSYGIGLLKEQNK